MSMMVVYLYMNLEELRGGDEQNFPSTGGGDIALRQEIFPPPQQASNVADWVSRAANVCYRVAVGRGFLGKRNGSIQRRGALQSADHDARPTFTSSTTSHERERFEHDVVKETTRNQRQIGDPPHHSSITTRWICDDSSFHLLIASVEAPRTRNLDAERQDQTPGTRA